MVDLSKFNRGQKGRGVVEEVIAPIDPEAIFKRAPKGPNSLKDIWRGQTDALREWHQNYRGKPDVLISLNTGGGKTVVGLLIAQSLVNEGLQNVVYACGSIDLVNQTIREARRLGLNPTERVGSAFSDDKFEIGESFCVTTYQALYNGKSVFRKKHLPEGIIFDDAHTSELFIRESYSINIEKNQTAYLELRTLFSEAFNEIGRKEEFFTSLVGFGPPMLVPPYFVFKNVEKIKSILKKDKINEKELFSWIKIADHIKHCAILISPDSVQITPPFLPISTSEYFSNKQTRRIYLSATLNYKSDLKRCTGNDFSAHISPKNDAGQGERLVLFAQGFTTKIMNQLAVSLKSKHKLLVSVPSYRQAKEWAAIATPPSADEFSKELQGFRSSANGAFILVHRLDGIDLPDDTCRLMIMDGLPYGFGLLESFLWSSLLVRNALSARLASRITQLFGRINRGTADFSAHIVTGQELMSWLRNKRNSHLLSPLLREQIQLGQEIQKQLEIRSVGDYVDLIQSFIGRDKRWTDLYQAEILDKELDSIDRARGEEIEKQMLTAVGAEIEFAAHCWAGDYGAARECLDSVVAGVARADPKLAGWYNIWIGFCYDVLGDAEAAKLEYGKAQQKLGLSMPLPQSGGRVVIDVSKKRFFDKQLGMLSRSAEHVAREINRLETLVKELDNLANTPYQNEEAVRNLGEQLGFQSFRPKTGQTGGPDVTWYDEGCGELLAFELKTDKNQQSNYTVSDIGNGLNYLSWLEQNFRDAKVLSFIFVGPDVPISFEAAPTPLMHQVEIHELKSIAHDLVELLRKAGKKAGLEREVTLRTAAEEAFSMQAISKRLSHTCLISKKKTRNK